MVCTDLILTQSKRVEILVSQRMAFMVFCNWLYNNKNTIDQTLQFFIISDLYKAGLTSGCSLCFIFHGSAGYKCFTI